MEAVPTVLILLALALRNQDLFFGNEENFLGISKTRMTVTTFSISVFSGSFGMAKFVKHGPCRIVPSQNLHCGFFLIVMSIATTLVGKGSVFAFSLFNKRQYDFTPTCLIWMFSCILPQFVLVS